MGIEDKAGLRDMLQCCIGPLHAAAMRSAERLGVGASSSTSKASGVHGNGHIEQAESTANAVVHRTAQTGAPEGASSIGNALSQGMQPGGLMESGMQAYMAVARLQQAAGIVVQLLERGLAHVPDAELRERARAFLEEP